MISIVVPAYNEEEIIARCLDGLVSQKTSEQFEVIVVDNKSTDRTSVIAQNYKDKLVLKIISEKRKGRSPARRAGFTVAKGEIIFSTDADTVVPPCWVDKIMAEFNDTSVIAVTGTGKIADCFPSTNMIFNKIQPLSMKIYRLLFGHYWLSGFNFAIRKEQYFASEGFHQDLISQEDTDLSWRVHKLGKIAFTDKVPVLCSGRRFKNGLIMGFLSYMATYFFNVVLKSNRVVLDDTR